MHLIFAVHTGKASLVTVAGRLIDMAEAEGFTCSMLDPNGVVKPSEDAAIVAVGGDGTVSDMLSFADKALYMSKKNRNCVTLVPFEEEK